VSRSKERQVRKTLLVVVEGDSEVALVKHLRQIYCANGAGVSVTIRNAHGKGPDNVIHTAIALKRSGEYDQIVAMLDTDLDWSSAIRKAADKSRIALLGSAPCLEGMLLAVLGLPVPQASDECKRVLQKRLATQMLDVQDYQAAFGRVVLQDARTRLTTLDRLLKFLEGVV
jgi:hypothetical protein